jgi:hypothetical protein
MRPGPSCPAGRWGSRWAYFKCGALSLRRRRNRREFGQWLCSNSSCVRITDCALKDRSQTQCRGFAVKSPRCQLVEVFYIASASFSILPSCTGLSSAALHFMKIKRLRLSSLALLAAGLTLQMASCVSTEREVSNSATDPRTTYTPPPAGSRAREWQNGAQHRERYSRVSPTRLPRIISFCSCAAPACSRPRPTSS